MTAKTTDEILAELKSATLPVLETLALYAAPQYNSLWRNDPRLHRAFVKKLIDSDHPNRAYELVREGLQEDIHPGDLRLQYLAALVMARSGNVPKAAELANALLATNNLDDAARSDALSLQGRLEKDLFQRTGDVAHAQASAAFYQQAFEVADDWFPGINAATMSLLAGREEQAALLAAQVIKLASAEQGQPQHDPDYWLLATLGESHMIRGEIQRAEGFYRQAVRIAINSKDEGNVAAMRRQVQLVARQLPQAATLLELFNLGNIVLFSGHMLDTPQRMIADGYRPRFPHASEIIDTVRTKIAARLEALDARVGYSGAACGGDLLFCEQLLKRGGALHVVLPFDLDDFYRTSVDFGLPEEMAFWRELCDRVLDQAVEIHYATQDRYLGDEVLFAYANSFVHGLARIRAARVGLVPTALCLFDPTAQGSVGTADMMQQIESCGGRVEMIDLAEIRESTSYSPTDPEPWNLAIQHQQTEPQRPIQRQRRAMLFADIKNYSKVNDERAPNFFIHYLDQVHSMLEGAEIQTLFQNTWGDGLFLVFSDAVTCADTALRLVERIESIDWPRHGLPKDTTVRVGVHYGPVYQHFDKIINQDNFFGGQVNRTARIEPVTTPGCVFASEQFAAELSVQPNHNFLLEYVGVEQLAKNYDRCSLYRLGIVSDPRLSAEVVAEQPLATKQNKTPYVPKPAATANIELSEDILNLTERLAENTHENWAAQRLADGWTRGPTRNDNDKKHPCLIPYADLPETEKQYDRNTAMETLKAIIALGYVIVSPDLQSK